MNSTRYPPTLQNRARQQASTASPRPENPLFFPFPHPLKTEIFFRLSLLIFIGEKKSPPTAHFFPVQIPIFLAAVLIPAIS